MTRIQRRIFKTGILVGALATITIIAVNLAGGLDWFENPLYDLRARRFQAHSSKPSDQLVHIDIEDRALDAIGSWPWPRARVAAILDELRLAGIKAVAMDILFSEPQVPNPILAKQDDGTEKVTSIVDNDAQLAAAVKNLGCVILPGSWSFDPPNPSLLYRSMVEELRKNPEIDEKALIATLAAAHPELPDAKTIIAAGFIEARKEAIFRRITDEMRSAPCSQDELRSRLLKNKQAEVSSPVSRAFDDQFSRWDSIATLERYGADIGPATPPLARVPSSITPIALLAHSAAGTGFVDYKTDLDGVLRSVPLLIEHEGRILPQVALSLAMMTLGVQTRDLIVDEHTLTIPCPDGRRIVIPIHSEYSKTQGRTVAAVFDIPWFGSSRWETMYDWPAHTEYKQHISITALYEPSETIGKIRKNNANAADVLPALCETLGIQRPTTRPTTSDDDEANLYGNLIDRVLTEGVDFEKAYLAMSPAELAADKNGKDFLSGFRVLRIVREENRNLATQLQDLRANLKKQLAGKSALIGWIATGFVDATSTSLHARCPGVIAHGVIFTSIMDNHFWQRSPFWVTGSITLILGILSAVVAALVSPMLGLFFTALLAAGYVYLNGSVLFDQHQMIVGLAGPLTVLGAVWMLCTANRIIIETNERAHITRRFRSYVDPTLVSHVIEHPDQVRLEGETRELTVVFTDLEGFTAISERLGEQVVPLLNEYMGLMVPLIRARNGYVNKMLGDGIMFFFGAPMPGSDHAEAAVETVLEMQKAMVKFNEELVHRKLPRLGMRAGITSGLMVVGDAGSPDASDYTVIGDTVNLAARLESANKITGTHVLINGRAAELVGDRFMLRPIGKFQVQGKAEGVMTYEPLAPASGAADRQKDLAKLTANMVEAFIAAKFDQTLAAADAMDAEFGPSGLTRLYRAEAKACLQNPPDASFDGRITFSEK
ncbi:MAG TPA: adenylate/guanylate cyclase domain-containing protein [Tepidisphaeraceae bacterium]|nr:adenylate/guanylate cyclase domain-containing protein [Tepidisphaeraceae bacterium]